MTQQLDSLKIKTATAQVHAVLTSASDAAFGMKKDLWLHTQVSATSHRLFALHLDNVERPPELLFNGAMHPQSIANLSVVPTFSMLRFSGVTGRPYGNGNISLAVDGKVLLKVIFHDITGRIRICSVEGRAYGYPAC